MRSIRFTLIGLFIVPLVTLVGLWGFAASVTLGQAIAKRHLDTQASDTGAPIQALLVQLTQERLQSFIWLGTGRLSPHTPVEFQRERTDAALAAFKKGVAAAEPAMIPAAKQSLAPLLSQIAQLPGIRNEIDFGAMNAPQAFQAYNGIVDAEFRFFDSQAIVNDVNLYRDSVAAVEIGRAQEMVGREIALVGGALAARGRMSAEIHNLFVQTLANQRFLEADGLPKLNAGPATTYRALFASPAYTSFKRMEDRISASVPGAPLPVSAADWQSGVQSFLPAFYQAGGAVRQDLTQGLRNEGNTILLRLALVAGAGLLAVIISVFLLLRFGRRITRELVGLREAARRLADERLPRVVSRLRRGEDVDVTAEVPPLYPGSTTEIANVAQAFATVQRTAIEAAVGQAQMRKGVNQVFLNLARRNQSLLHRQLDMLDSMERAAPDPEALENFFRLDHLTTRMRRHAEGLIILSGEAPGRGWRSPVRVLDVLRAAISEVEDYVRVDIVNESRDAVVGTAVADVIHLLAELIENATAFSPPNTRVTVSADRVGSGFAVEIEDRGLGISLEELAEINGRLASPPEFDLADSDRLGLFVVGQLAARHQIKVSLVESPFGGTLAVVLMPHTIVVSETELASTDSSAYRGPQAALGMGEAAAALPTGTTPRPDGPALGGANGWQRISPPAPGERDGRWPVPEPAPPGGPPRVPGPDPAPEPVGAALEMADAPPETHDAWPNPLDVPEPWRDTPVAPAPWLETAGAPDSWPGATGAPATPRHAPQVPTGMSNGAAGSGLQDRPHPGSGGTHAAASGTAHYGSPAGAAAQAGAQAGAQPADTARMALPADGTAGTYMGLPRRVRQASLAPQLRAAPAPEAKAATTRLTDPGQRSPEDTRAIMTSLQQGWQRGRADALPAWDEVTLDPPATAPGEESAMDAEGRDA